MPALPKKQWKWLGKKASKSDFTEDEIKTIKEGLKKIDEIEKKIAELKKK